MKALYYIIQNENNLQTMTAKERKEREALLDDKWPEPRPDKKSFREVYRQIPKEMFPFWDEEDDIL